MRKLSALMTAAIAVAAAGCGSSTSPSTSTSSGTSSAGASPATASSSGTGTKTAAGGGVNPNQRETLPPGDIPDTIAYVPYAAPGKGITLSTPEGWSRSSVGGTIKFTDKLNAIRLFTLPAGGPVTVSSAKRTEVPKIASSVKTFKLKSVSTVSRSAGPAVRIVYTGDSAPNPVTGKVGTLAFERYDFFHKGRQVVLLLSSPLGSDNVDPWKKVTESLRFTR
jgi:hypothetical protein